MIPIRVRTHLTVLWFTALLGTVPLSAIALPITDSLVAWWDFSGAGTSDSSGNGRTLELRANPNATAGAAPTVVPGGVGGGSALHMPGSTSDSRVLGVFDGHVVRGDAFLADAVSGPEAVDLISSAGRAVQAWVRFDEFRNNYAQTIVGKASDGAPSARDGWLLDLFQDAGGQQMIEFFAHTAIGPVRFFLPVSFGIGEWHHIVVSGPANALNVYLDGVFIGASPFGASAFTGGTDASLSIGSDFRSFAGVPDIRVNPMLGSLDKIALWNREVTPDEIGALYNRGAGVSLDQPTGVSAPSPLLLLAAGIGVLVLRRKRVGTA